MNRYKPYMLAYSSLFFGLGSLLLFMIFLFLGSFTIFDLGLKKGEALFLDGCLSLLFFIQHSVMIRKKTRKKLSIFIPDEYYNAFYSIASGVTLTALNLIWQKIPYTVASAGNIAYWVLRTLFVLSLVGFTWATSSLGSFDPFGAKIIIRSIRNKTQRPVPMTIRGAYRWVRHPLYLFSILMIWSCPVLTADRLLFNILWTGWIVIATMLEEQDLVFDFGDQYREYQAKVPMIIPYKLP
jgi:protein-S-isoprenylcysteine O-methyltransferase Ste14